MDKYYPIFLKIEQRLCVVVGGGAVAERKVKGLLEAGARVKVIAPEVTEELANLATQGQIELHQRPFQTGDLEGAWLVFAATNQRETQEAVSQEAQKKSIPCNIADDPQGSSFIVPSVVRRGRLQIALSTSGASPAVARRLREQLEDLFGPEYEEFLALMARWRREILNQDLPPEKRRQIFELLALAPIPLWLKRKEHIHLRNMAKNLGLSMD